MANIKLSFASSSFSMASADGADKDKCEVILTAGEASTVDLGLFPNDFKVTRDRNFELLGGPIGTSSWCNQVPSRGICVAIGVDFVAKCICHN